MFPELSLHILDVVQNSISAGANLTEISITAHGDILMIIIKDNGCGMTEEQLSRAADPFFTTRSTRDVGLGISFFKDAAEMTGGTFNIESQPGIGTTITAVFGLSHIDRMPLGDMTSTVRSLIILNNDRDFVYSLKTDSGSFTLDTRKMREIMGDIPLSEPEISVYIKEYLTENTNEIGGNKL